MMLKKIKNILHKIFLKIESDGIRGLISALNRRMFSKKALPLPEKALPLPEEALPLPEEALCFSICQEFISNKIGLEVGGPSTVFNREGILPIYPIVKQLDNCNFSRVTTWEGSIKEGLNFNFDENSLPGQQYVSEATDLGYVDSAKYDFILSSHMLEHSANPLKALSEWRRILKDRGFIVIILPHKDATFDRHRPTTTLNHIIEDFNSGTQEDDLTHLPEILRLHDLSRDPAAGTLESFKERSEKNFENRCLHHHVFDTNLAIHMLHQQHLQIHAVEPILPLHIIVIAQKVPDEVNLKNENFLKDTAEYKLSSPFPSDLERQSTIL
jgi:SAM-dependent methyltransferase